MVQKAKTNLSDFSTEKLIPGDQGLTAKHLWNELEETLRARSSDLTSMSGLRNYSLDEFSAWQKEHPKPSQMR